jgi:hypothetical protein
MSQPTLKELAIAWLNGATIQQKYNRDPIWRAIPNYDPNGTSGIHFHPSATYRIKPQPRDFYALPTATVDVGGESPVDVVRLYEYRSDAVADKEQYRLAGDIIHLREVLPE